MPCQGRCAKIVVFGLSSGILALGTPVSSDAALLEPPRARCPRPGTSRTLRREYRGVVHQFAFRPAHVVPSLPAGETGSVPAENSV